MGAELSALLDKPLVLIVVLAIGAAVGMGVEKFWSGIEREKRKAYWRGRNTRKSAPLKAVPKSEAKQDEKDLAADQLKLVMKADFRRRALLNQSEGKVFQSLDRMVIERNPEWQVMAQVSVGEFLSCEDKDAYLAINSKRVDFVLMDENCQACLALEYQGNGHHQGSAAARDAVKKEALRKAGVGYHEIVAGHTTPGELRLLVEKLVPPPAGVAV